MSDAFDLLERANDSDELRVETKKFAKEMGFEHFAYVLTINAPSLKNQQYVLSGYPPGWVERYVSRDYFKIDPVIKQTQEGTLPVIWGGSLSDGKDEEFWDEARQFGLQAGLSISVHEQPGVRGLFSLARDKALDMHGQDLAALMGRAQMFAILLHHAVSRIEIPKLLPEQDVSLTAREQECLKWAADGKTAWEIGKILGISEHTAVFHLNNVIRKLGAKNKIQAIVRAVTLRLI